MHNNIRLAQQKNHRILIALLKEHGIRKVVASPGGSNVPFVASIQQDPFFEIYSAIDERSAAYVASGMAGESGEPVVICCTGATASRNYYPGLTEAFYRKLPILAVTAHVGTEYVGQLRQQVLDRSATANDLVLKSVNLPPVVDAAGEFLCTLRANDAILALKRNGGGPAHINLCLGGWYDFSASELPPVRKIDRVLPSGPFPELPEGASIGIIVGSHREWSQQETSAAEAFCAAHNAAMLCEHTSGYHGGYRVLYPLILVQKGLECMRKFDLIIHIGEISSCNRTYGCKAKQVWRVSEDGELRDTFRSLTNVFEMSPAIFFNHYAAEHRAENTLYPAMETKLQQLMALPDDALPFSNCWAARRLAPRMPENSVLHLGILNSLRVWNYTLVPDSLRVYSNVGGFGTDGALSSLLGASLVHPGKLYFGVVGDLAFFYDLNSLGNRHVGSNLRIMLVNNGKGFEFHLEGGAFDIFGDEVGRYISAAGHNGRQSPDLVRHYAQDLGFEYMSAHDKMEFDACIDRFTQPGLTDKPMLLELFTSTEDERVAVDLLWNQDAGSGSSSPSSVAGMGKALGHKLVHLLKK